jgi:hypothetical protein
MSRFGSSTAVYAADSTESRARSPIEHSPEPGVVSGARAAIASGETLAQLASGLIPGRAGDGARANDTDPPGWRVNGRDVVDDDSTAPTNGDDDLRDRWRLARWLLGPLALAAVVLPDEHAPVARRQAHKHTCFQAGVFGIPHIYSLRLKRPVRRAGLGSCSTTALPPLIRRWGPGRLSFSSRDGLWRRDLRALGW